MSELDLERNSETDLETEENLLTSDENGNIVIPKLRILKDEADALGIKYPKNITADKLEEKIEEHRKEMEEKKRKETEVNTTVSSNYIGYDSSRVGRVKEEAHKLIRFKLVVNDPNLQDATGIQVTAGNDIIGHITRIIPTNAESWHAEAIIVEHLKSQMFQRFKSKTNNRGITYMDNKDSSLLPKFTVIELPPLSEEELAKLKEHQLKTNTGRSLD